MKANKQYKTKMQTTLTILTGLLGDDFGTEETANLSYGLTEAQTCEDCMSSMFSQTPAI